MTAYLIIGLMAAAMAYVVTPLVRWLSIRIGAIDRPSDRKVHAQATPTIGGAAIFIALAAAGTAAFFLPQFRPVFTQSSEWLGMALGAVVIFTLGLVDDFRSLAAPAKLAGQVLAAGIVFLAGTQMRFLPFPDTILNLDDNTAALVTILWLVAMMNAVNLVDGLDGLAAGIVAIAASAFFVYAYQLQQEIVDVPTGPLVAIIVVGASLGFLRYNFYPAKIFMGDSGAMLLGLLLGAATISGVGRAPYELGPSASFLAYFPLLIPLMVMAIPFLDVLLAVIRRTRRRRSIAHADKEHLHHRLMDLGHGHRQAVIVMYVWSALAGGAALAYTFLDRSDLVYALPVAVGALVLYTLFPLLTKVVQERLRP